MVRPMTLLRLLRLVLRGAAVVAAVAGIAMAVAWGVGRVLIARAEPDGVTTLPDGVPGRLVAVDGRAVHVVEAGDGPAVLLVPDLGRDARDWAPIAGRLAADHRVVAVDLLGSGWSARDPDLPYGLALWADQLGATLRALGLARATFVGHGAGAAAATLLARGHPGHVERLVLVAPLVGPLDATTRLDARTVLATPGAGELALGLLGRLPALPGFPSLPDDPRADPAWRVRGTRDAVLRAVRHGLDPAAVDDALAGLSVPTLLVLGTDDAVVPYPAQRRAALRVPDALVLPLDGVGHDVAREAPERLLDALRTPPPAA